MTAAGKRQRRAGKDRRRNALEVAARVLAERGYEKTRFSDVAEAAGVAVSTLQFYFGSRDDMLIEALYHSTETEVAVLEQIAAGAADPWERILALLDRGLAPLSATTWRMLLEFWHASAHDPELRTHSVSIQERYRGAFAKAVREGVESGDFRPRGRPEDIVTAVVALLDGLIIPRVLDHPYFDQAGVRDVAITQVAAVLGLDADRVPRGDGAAHPNTVPQEHDHTSTGEDRSDT
ncbi:TetR/AcrR family transcriptional regulator [Actinomadura craniellae]|uniref:TetR/AcrR family transcriptional regulator n=1 Tax=Actinomadura craniellae TaxID=2231787 RepID=UPI0011BEEBB0|nr:TetR/AcrR family transcriptional regulator [Actinomadura craniellae]